MQMIVKNLYLKNIDSFWMDHLEHMDHVREGIGFQGYAQVDPLIVYKKEAFGIFQTLLVNINRSVVSAIFKVEAVPQGNIGLAENNIDYSGGEEPVGFNGMDVEEVSGEQQLAGNENNVQEQQQNSQPIINQNKEVGRNDPCPCGSGKKYKKCCGK
jgi:preprotein translocase subunit SecA